jgi:hypothetical protein
MPIAKAAVAPALRASTTGVPPLDAPPVPLTHLFFDLDSTLLDTHMLFSQRIRPALQEYLVVTDEELAEVERQYREGLAKSTDFDPDIFLKSLAESFSAPIEELRQVFFTPGFFRESVYDDVLPVLEVLAASFVLGIYSEGVGPYQQRKLELSGLIKWFEPEQVLIAPRKLESAVIGQLPLGSWVVDDNIEVVEQLVQRRVAAGSNSNLDLGARELTVCWLRRNEEAVSETESATKSVAETKSEAGSYLTINSLIDLFELIESSPPTQTVAR